MNSQITHAAHAKAPRSARAAHPQPGVLVALDGSAAAATALPAAQRLAQRLGMPLRVLHVATGSLAGVDVAALLHVDPAVAAEVAVEVRSGDPASEILRAIGEKGTYLTVLTTHGRTIEAGRQLSQVAEQVIAHTALPILLIRPEAAAPDSAMLEAPRFLLPLDGKAATARALGGVMDIVQRLGGSFDVLFVADPAQLTSAGRAEPGSLELPQYVDQPQHEWPAWMRAVLDHLSAGSERYPLDIPVRVHVASGRIASVVLEFVATHQDDVIVLVRRSRLQHGRATILRAVLDRTQCPVLLTGTAAARSDGRR